MRNYDISLYNRYMQEANAYAASYGIDSSSMVNNSWDAFRHAYASGAMTMEIGAKIAQFFGYLNEIYYGDYKHKQSVDERNMDEWNNSVGRDIGKTSTSSDEIARRVYDALR